VSGIVETLIDAGASPTIRASDGKLKDKLPVDILQGTDDAKAAPIRAALERPPAPARAAVPAPAAAEEASASAASAAGADAPAAPVQRPVFALHPNLKLLWPYPKRVLPMSTRTVRLPPVTTVMIQGGKEFVHELKYVWNRLEASMKEYGVRLQKVADFAGAAVHMIMIINPKLFQKEEEYRLRIGTRGVCISAGHAKGINYGVTTYLQAMRLCGNGQPELPELTISDCPDLSIRGFMLDVSRNKIPTMKSLETLVDTLASLKYNQLQLYFENTFAYQNHRAVWNDIEPLTGAEILHLDALCQERFIQLVPHQNSCGHMHKFLVHDEYRALAEVPEGIDFGPRPSGPRDAPWSLCPTDPGSIHLMRQLYNELVPHFPSSSYLHVGLNETKDVGLGRSKKFVDEYGSAQIFMEYLHKIRDIAYSVDRTMMFWTDMIIDAPDEVLADLPPEVIACEGGYEDDHPFDERLGRLADLGIATVACPGTSSWNSLTGRTANCIENIKSAAKAAAKHNCLGLVLTDWGDFGHLQPLEVSYPALITAAGLSWNSKTEVPAFCFGCLQPISWKLVWQTRPTVPPRLPAAPPAYITFATANPHAPTGPNALPVPSDSIEGI